MGLVALGGAVAACSGPPASPGVAGAGPTASTTAAPSAGQATGKERGFMAKLLAYTHCMRGHGIADFPDPVAASGGQGGGFSISAGPGSDLDPNNPRYEAANRTCQPLLPNEGTLPPPTAKQLAEEVNFASCVRRHGFATFPDPNNQGTFVLNNFDLSSPRFQSVRETCRSLAHLTGPMRVNATNSGPAAPVRH